jgi:hypothetical protein
VVSCRAWKDDSFSVRTELSLFDVWRARPEITQYWGRAEFKFNNWTSFAREQTWRFNAIAWQLISAWRKLTFSASYRKEVSVERYATLKTVRELSSKRDAVSSWVVCQSIVGKRWMERPDASKKLDEIETMLAALVDLQEIQKTGNGFVINGKGIASLSQYEEEERKHRESMRLQSGIKWLTGVMVIAALLQAKVINIPALWTIHRWPWQ